jgi:hypothetical protein
MTSIDVYRANAADCMRLAASDEAESDRPLWATLARSWLQLAEQADGINETAEPDAAEATPEAADEKPAQN